MNFTVGPDGAKLLHQHGGGWPWITECSVCEAVAARGMRSVCLISSRRTPRGRVRQCHGAIFRRYDLEDAVRTATDLGGAEAGLELWKSITDEGSEEMVRPRKKRP